MGALWFVFNACVDMFHFAGNRGEHIVVEHSLLKNILWKESATSQQCDISASLLETLRTSSHKGVVFSP